MVTGRAAVFLDRDGTLTRPRHYPSRPEHLVLADHVGPWLRVLQAQGVALVVVTNQSGLARGYFGATDLDAMHQGLRGQLAAWRVRLDGIYACPHHVDGSVAHLAVRCGCRKPAPGILLRAAGELRLDPARSWMVGDAASDVAAGHRAGCRTALVGPPAPGDTESAVRPDLRTEATWEALRHIAERLGDAGHTRW
ncbi:D-glycero-alpha-D-manno-heptose-1,7-bisphosphate 7-phosphatase [Streptomyces chrestomyceticus]|uniref:D-glycero-alpha-D-manno-heptose-1,7-bisphosphate 7-phosphatase n=1 Tax=Streptomyces chrestomyceticus TaxID=68185 RepID=UPI0033D19FA4